MDIMAAEKIAPFVLAKAFVVDPGVMPYLSTTFFRITFVPVSGDKVKTFAVDKWWRCYYNEEMAETAEPEVLATGILQIMLLLLGDTFGRHNNREFELWKMAHGMSVNEGLRESQKSSDRLKGLKFPEGTIFPDSAEFKFPPNLMAEEYYDLLLKKYKDCPPPPSSGSSKPEVSGGKGGSESPADQLCDPSDPKSWEQGPPSEEHPGVSPAEQEAVLKQTAEEIKTASSRGTVPAFLERWAEGILYSKIPWQKVFESFCKGLASQKAGLSDYSYSRRHRRQTVYAGKGFQIIFPGMIGLAYHGVLITDTSLSTGFKGYLEQVTAEIHKILNTVDLLDGLKVISCDAAVGAVQKIFSVKKLNFVGGGGTDMRVGIDEALKTKPRPRFCIVVTDGETPWPNSPVGIPIIALVIGRTPEEAKKSAKQVPAFIKTLVVD